MNSPILSPLQLGDGDLFGMALLEPGLTSDLSTWTVTIHKHGLLTQTVLVRQPPRYDDQLVVLRQSVPRERIDGLKQIVLEEDLLTFGAFPTLYATDQEQTRLVIHLFGQRVTIDAYGPNFTVECGGSDEDNAKARRYCRLWEAILELTPFTPYGGLR